MALDITMLTGFCPVQGEGSFDGTPFYFRARGTGWSLWLGKAFNPNDLIAQHKDPDRGEFWAGHMPLDEARSLIEAAYAEHCAGQGTA